MVRSQLWVATQDWAEGLGTPLDFVSWLPTIVAGFLGLSFLFLLMRAWTQRDRYRAETVLGEAERATLETELEEAERHTTGEVVVVVLERSDRHPAGPWIAGVLTLLLGSAALATWMPWETPLLFFGAQIAFGGLGMLAALYVPGFRRVFVSESRATEMAEEQAVQEFFGLNLQATEGRTGVLLFVSLFERRVIVLGDEGIDARLDASHWEEADNAVLEGVRRGDLMGGLERAIQICAGVLAQHFPNDGENPNEVPNHVVVRAE